MIKFTTTLREGDGVSKNGRLGVVLECHYDKNDVLVMWSDGPVTCEKTSSIYPLVAIEKLLESGVLLPPISISQKVKPRRIRAPHKRRQRRDR